MNTSFYNSISGVVSSQFYIDVVGNNIANVNTNGFKSSTAEISSLFSSILSSSTASTNDIGLGASSQVTTLNMAQGSLQTTDNTFDLALEDEGWFGVLGADGTTYYTRAGSFSLDGNGNLVDGDGNYLLVTLGDNMTETTLDAETLEGFGTTDTTQQAYAITEVDDVALGSVGDQTKVTLPLILYYPPVATTEASYGANLDPTVTVDSVNVDLDAADYPSTVTPSTTGTISLSGTVSNTTAALDPQEGDVVIITLTDADGLTQTINTKLDENLAWSLSDYDVSGLNTSSDITVTSAVLQTSQEVANKEHFTMTVIGPDGDKDILDMTFTKVVPQGEEGTTWNAAVNIYSYYEEYDSTKTYDTSLYYVNESTKKVYEIVDSQTGALTFNSDGSLTSNTIPTLNNGGTALTLDLGTIDSFDGMISSTSIEKSNIADYNGSVEGYLTAYDVDDNGNVVATFSNGKSSSVAKIAVYHFQNDQGLTQVSSTLFAESANSGNPIFYTDANGNTILGSSIANKTLETSNTDLATALTELIIVQKSFSASAKGITTSDELLQNAINMKQ
ncbi:MULTISPECIES: flagellar hook-basal body complex protein [unclassified Sulfurospirillum]|uniref:flagellar hook-basal body complex protein n=1 Tax=unclassified Sulfurospirillum TaxID=2618290 RepID=UPI0005066E82|nr:MULTISPECIES: flagellar hook-basal body complex protein [unclassified Sulfurospirillum]KFL33760.1 flagellar hook-basal body protein [Sulfurospirillum sp. SCADC]